MCVVKALKPADVMTVMFLLQMVSCGPRSGTGTKLSKKTKEQLHMNIITTLDTGRNPRERISKESSPLF